MTEHIQEALMDLLASNGWLYDGVPGDEVIQVFVDDWSFDLRIENVDVVA